MDKKQVYSFKRNEEEQVMISIGTYKEKEYVDVRIFFKDPNSGEWRPTKKGVTLNRLLLGELREGLRQVEEVFVEVK